MINLVLFGSFAISISLSLPIYLAFACAHKTRKLLSVVVVVVDFAAVAVPTLYTLMPKCGSLLLMKSISCTKTPIRNSQSATRNLLRRKSDSYGFVYVNA